MRIYTEVNFKWNGNKYVETSSKSENYDGSVDLLRAFDDVKDGSRKTWFDEDGVKWEIIEKRGKFWEEFSYSKQGYVLYKDGQAMSWSGDVSLGQTHDYGTKISSSEDYSAFKSAVQTEHGGDKWMTSSEYSEFKTNLEAEAEAEAEAKEYEAKLKKETATISQRMTQEAEAQSKLTSIQAGKVQSEQLRTLESALLAQGSTPEEAQAMTAKGQEAAAGISQQIGAAKDVSLQQALTGLAQMDLGSVTSAQDLNMALKGMSQELAMHKSSLANALQQAKMSLQGQQAMAGATASAGQAGMWGDIASGLGTFLGGLNSGGE